VKLYLLRFYQDKQARYLYLWASNPTGLVEAVDFLEIRPAGGSNDVWTVAPPEAKSIPRRAVGRVMTHEQLQALQHAIKDGKIPIPAKRM
jgi:hypothetical protein